MGGGSQAGTEGGQGSDPTPRTSRWWAWSPPIGQTHGAPAGTLGCGVDVRTAHVGAGEGGALWGSQSSILSAQISINLTLL